MLLFYNFIVFFFTFGKKKSLKICCVIGSTEAPSKAFLLFFLLSDWLKLNHLKSRVECGFSDIFSRHICSTVAKTIRVTNYTASFGAKNVQKTTFEAAEMILGPWNQQCVLVLFTDIAPGLWMTHIQI